MRPNLKEAPPPRGAGASARRRPGVRPKAAAPLGLRAWERADAHGLQQNGGRLACMSPGAPGVRKGKTVGHRDCQPCLDAMDRAVKRKAAEIPAVECPTRCALKALLVSRVQAVCSN